VEYISKISLSSIFVHRCCFPAIGVLEVKEPMRLLDPTAGSFFTGKDARHGDATFPVFFYTSRRLPPVRIGGRSIDDESAEAQAQYEVRVIDNDYNTYQEVIEIAMLTLGISEDQAFVVAWEVDHLGSCVVAHAPKAEAEEIANLIRTIGIEVQVNPINEAAC
jgi:ATP-dependent Clp protease adapter protein ClpS